MLEAILSTVACLVLAMPSAAQCPGEVVQNSTVNSVDLLAVLSAWGTNGQGAFDADINDNGIVGAPNLSIVLNLR